MIRRCQKRMRIRLKGIEKNNRVSLFAQLDCQYDYEKIYLGAKSKVFLNAKGIQIVMSFSERDGIWVKIKRDQPYRILFEWADGIFHSNDDTKRNYDTLVAELHCLQQMDQCKFSSEEIFDKLEEILYRFATEA